METIILNRMYVGSYLDESENIGHEVINLFKDDNGSNYIYLNESGAIAKTYNDTVKAVLLVKYVEMGVFEVIAKAEGTEWEKGLQQVYYKEDDDEKDNENQNKYIEDNQITYGDVLLSDIYKNGYNEIRITFKADEVIEVKNPVFLIYDESKKDKYENSYFLHEKNFATTSLRIYYTDKDQPKDYQELKDLIDSDLWCDENTTKKIKEIDEFYSYDSHEGFLSVIKKEDDELVMSNLFSYIFNAEKNVFRDFVIKVLGIDDFDREYTIFREKDNIDLLIETEDIETKKSVIIIENKIKSKINGERLNSNGEVESQLSKYVNYAKKEYKELYDKDKVEFFIFAPDYNQIDLNNYKYGDKYTPVRYSQIYDFYFKNAGRMLNVEYFKEFLDVISIHTMSTDNTNYEKMKKKFIKNIKNRQALRK